MSKIKIKITKSQVENDILNGFTRKELAEKYDVPQTQITALINALGLKGVRARKFMFEIVEEEPVTTQAEETVSEESVLEEATHVEQNEEVITEVRENSYNIIN